MGEYLFAKVGGKLIGEGGEEKLLAFAIDKNLNFYSHLTKKGLTKNFGSSKNFKIAIISNEKVTTKRIH